MLHQESLNYLAKFFLENMIQASSAFICYNVNLLRIAEVESKTKMIREHQFCVTNDEILVLLETDR